MSDSTTSAVIGGQLERRAVRLGIVPLTDCAPIAVAHELGFFRKWGLDVSVSREPSWANIRDKVAAGVLDGAQMLAALPLAATLGLGGVAKPMVAALSLDLNGNAITLSSALWREILSANPAAAVQRPLTAGALRPVIARRQMIGARRLVFAAVFPFSAHNYLLRYWLDSAGIDPDSDVELVVVPPPLMVAKLEARHIDGFCVGAPWDQRAVELGIGRLAITSRDIWTNHPEKVFGVTREWADRHPCTHRALMAALIEACRWLDEPEHRAEAARILATRGYVDLPEDIVARSLTGTVKYGPDEAPRHVPDFHVFARHAANFPWRSHALWTLTQMRRWGQIGGEVDLHAIAAAVYRPDIYREVAAALGLACPSVDHKREDLFLDGRRFDPMDLAGSLARLSHSRNDTMAAAAVKRRR